MPRLSKVLSAGLIFSGIAIAATAAVARSATKQESILLKQAAAECKAIAKANRLGWRARRKFMQSCVNEKLKQHSDLDVRSLLKTLS